MSGSSEAAQGIAALEAKDYDKAVLKLSKALGQSRSPAWLIARSKAYVVGLGDFARGLSDAEFAFAAATRRGNRALMQEAQYRRAVALFRMGRYADADACTAWMLHLIDGTRTSDPVFTRPEVDENGSATMTKERFARELKQAEKERGGGDVMAAMGGKTSPERNMANNLRLQILARLDTVPADERRVSVKFVPDVSIDDFKVEAPAETKSKTDEKEAKGKGGSDDDDDDDDDRKELKSAAAESVRNAKPPQQDVRVDFFQSSTTMSVSVFVKNVPKEELKVEYDSAEVRLSHIPGHEPWYTIRLWGTIDPSGSKHTVGASKIELQLKKAEAAKWPVLQRGPDAGPTAPSVAARSEQQPKASSTAAAAAGAPAYPTSSKTGPKNWEGVGDDEEDERDINAFFKKMYAGATPEQQRAMMKSFVESNGTALSTDWDDVKARKVQTQPPEGVEAKKWDS